MIKFSIPRIKRILAMLLVIVMVLGMLPLSVFAAEVPVSTAKVEFTKDGVIATNMTVKVMDGDGKDKTAVYDEATGALKLVPGSGAAAHHLMGKLSDAFMKDYDGKAKVKVTFIDHTAIQSMIHFVYNGDCARTYFSTRP